MIIREHDIERFWLERRLELLSILDSHANEAFNDSKSELNIDDPRFTMLRKQYADVLEPYSLSETIRKIYPEHLYGKIPKKKYDS
jgi:hypothetical protein